MIKAILGSFDSKKSGGNCVNIGPIAIPKTFKRNDLKFYEFLSD